MDPLSTTRRAWIIASLDAALALVASTEVVDPPTAPEPELPPPPAPPAVSFSRLGTQTLMDFLTGVRSAMPEGLTAANARLGHTGGVMAFCGAVVWRDKYTLPVSGGHTDSYDDGAYAFDLATGRWQTLLLPSASAGAHLEDPTNAGVNAYGEFEPYRPASQHSYMGAVVVGNDIIQTQNSAVGHNGQMRLQAHRFLASTMEWERYATGEQSSLFYGPPHAWHDAARGRIWKIALTVNSDVMYCADNNVSGSWTSVPVTGWPSGFSYYGVIGFHPTLDCFVLFNQHEVALRDRLWVLDAGNLAAGWVEVGVSGYLGPLVHNGGSEYVPPLGALATASMTEPARLYYLTPAGGQTDPWKWSHEDFFYGDSTPHAWEDSPGVPGSPWGRLKWSSYYGGLVALKSIDQPLELFRPSAAPEFGVLSLRQMNPAGYVVFSDYAYTLGTYTRQRNNTLLSGTTHSIEFHGNSLSSIPIFMLKASGYTLLCDGAAIAHVSVTPLSVSRLSFVNVNFSAIADGWHLLDIEPDDGVENCAPHWVYLAKTGTVGSQAFAPAETGSYGLFGRGEKHVTTKVPPTITRPQGYPMATRTATPFATAATPDTLYRRDIVPVTAGEDPTHLWTTDEGMRSTISQQAYAWSTFIAAAPTLVVRDGPRGIGTLAGATHLQVARRGGTYFLDTWRFGHITPDGAVRTIAGKHRLEDGTTVLEGDWSAIPVERRGLHEPWGFAWDTRSLEPQDTSRLLDRGDGVMEHPHLPPGPVLFIADAQNRRTLKLQFEPVVGSVPVVTEFITNQNDPWDIVFHDGKLYISERQDDRIAVYDASTGAYIRTLVSGTPGLVTWPTERTHVLHASIATIRAEPCIGPEGLFIQDGFLYFGSAAMEQVRKVDLTTDAVSVLPITLPESNYKYIKISMSDGTFGPRGTVFVSAWELMQGGMPLAYLPDGTFWPNRYSESSSASIGVGGSWSGMNYSTASAVGQGKLLGSSASYGLTELSKAAPGDLVVDYPRYRAGFLQYVIDGHSLVHGPDGFSQFDLPLPWGLSADMDYYLSCHGHARKT